MFDVGFSELVLLFVIGLLVLGPQKLPKVAAEIGKWVGRARRTATQLRRQLEREIELSEIEPPKPPPGQPSSPPPAEAAAAAEPPAPPPPPAAEPSSAVEAASGHAVPSVEPVQTSTLDQSGSVAEPQDNKASVS
jgi:sec-independent protein translocase protein TatB